MPSMAKRKVALKPIERYSVCEFSHPFSVANAINEKMAANRTMSGRRDVPMTKNITVHRKTAIAIANTPGLLNGTERASMPISNIMQKSSATMPEKSAAIKPIVDADAYSSSVNA